MSGTHHFANRGGCGDPVSLISAHVSLAVLCLTPNCYGNSTGQSKLPPQPMVVCPRSLMTNDPAQQRRGTGELEVPETIHAPPSAAAPGSAVRPDRGGNSRPGPFIGSSKPQESKEAEKPQVAKAAVDEAQQPQQAEQAEITQ